MKKFTINEAIERLKKRLIKLGFTKELAQHGIEKYDFILREFYPIVKRGLK